MLRSLASSLRARYGAAPANEKSTASLAVDGSWTTFAIVALALWTTAAAIFLPLFTYWMASRSSIAAPMKNDDIAEGAVDARTEKHASRADPPPRRAATDAAAAAVAQVAVASALPSATPSTPTDSGAAQRGPDASPARGSPRAWASTIDVLDATDEDVRSEAHFEEGGIEGTVSDLSDLNTYLSARFSTHFAGDAPLHVPESPWSAASSGREGSGFAAAHKAASPRLTNVECVTREEDRWPHPAQARFVDAFGDGGERQERTVSSLLAVATPVSGPARGAAPTVYESPRSSPARPHFAVSPAGEQLREKLHDAEAREKAIRNAIVAEHAELRRTLQKQALHMGVDVRASSPGAARTPHTYTAVDGMGASAAVSSPARSETCSAEAVLVVAAEGVDSSTDNATASVVAVEAVTVQAAAATARAAAAELRAAIDAAHAEIEDTHTEIVAIAARTQSRTEVGKLTTAIKAARAEIEAQAARALQSEDEIRTLQAAFTAAQADAASSAALVVTLRGAARSTNSSARAVSKEAIQTAASAVHLPAEVALPVVPDVASDAARGEAPDAAPVIPVEETSVTSHMLTPSLRLSERRSSAAHPLRGSSEIDAWLDAAPREAEPLSFVTITIEGKGSLGVSFAIEPTSCMVSVAIAPCAAGAISREFPMTVRQGYLPLHSMRILLTI